VESTVQDADTASDLNVLRNRIANVQQEISEIPASFDSPPDAETEVLRKRSEALKKELADIPAATVSSDTSGFMDAKELVSKMQVQNGSKQDEWLPVSSPLHAAKSPQSKTPVPQQEKQPSTVDFALRDSRVQVDTDTAKGRAINPVSVRPNAGKAPEKIEFGLFAKNFYGIGLSNNNFVIDVVMTLKWTDKRVAALIPEGMEEMTLSKTGSEKGIWLPQVAITNRDIKRYDLISTAVSINRKGEVVKVERATSVVKNKYKLDHYPYDEQDLVVKIGSTKYMIDEVVLEPSKEGIGAAKNLLKGSSYDFVKVGANSFKDVDGALKKSGGLLTISVKRTADEYFQSHLIPASLLVVISCGIHYFPFVAPFITPRVALSVLALLAFTNLMLASFTTLPSGAPFNWNDLINQTILMIMFTNICMNIFAESVYHQMKVDDLGKSMNHELKVLIPLMSFGSLSVIYSAAGPGGFMSLQTSSYVAKLIIIGTMFLYICLCVTRLNAALAKKAGAEAKAADAPAAIPMGTNPNLKGSA